jgi:hypothetical protein
MVLIVDDGTRSTYVIQKHLRDAFPDPDQIIAAWTPSERAGMCGEYYRGRPGGSFRTRGGGLPIKSRSATAIALAQRETGGRSGVIFAMMWVRRFGRSRFCGAPPRALERGPRRETRRRCRIARAPTCHTISRTANETRSEQDGSPLSCGQAEAGGGGTKSGVLSTARSAGEGRRRRSASSLMPLVPRRPRPSGGRLSLPPR